MDKTFFSLLQSIYINLHFGEIKDETTYQRHIIQVVKGLAYAKYGLA